MTLHRHDNPTKSALVAIARRNAARGWFEGTDQTQNYLINHCRHLHLPTGTVAIYTRDRGHHACGWWKNPDYDRCLHLSLSFFDPETMERDEHNHRLAAEWVDLFFGKHKRWIWVEPPYSDHGRAVDSWHYRLFINPGGDPIKPRGEVYHRENTPAGWLSWSDAQEVARLDEKARRGREE